MFVQCAFDFFLSRGLSGLRAAHLKVQVVLTGGYDGSNNRDEVLRGII